MRSRWAGPGGLAAAASGWPTSIPGYGRRCWPWSSRTPGVIPCRRCGGRRRPTRKLAAELTRQGHRISADTVADVLREEGFSLQGNAKTIEGKQSPDRDAQFRYISGQAAGHPQAR